VNTAFGATTTGSAPPIRLAVWDSGPAPLPCGSTPAWPRVADEIPQMAGIHAVADVLAHWGWELVGITVMDPSPCDLRAHAHLGMEFVSIYSPAVTSGRS
jgi:hypothetical protein